MADLLTELSSLQATNALQQQALMLCYWAIAFLAASAAWLAAEKALMPWCPEGAAACAAAPLHATTSHLLALGAGAAAYAGNTWAATARMALTLQHPCHEFMAAAVPAAISSFKGTIFYSLTGCGALCVLCGAIYAAHLAAQHLRPATVYCVRIAASKGPSLRAFLTKALPTAWAFKAPRELKVEAVLAMCPFPSLSSLPLLKADPEHGSSSASSRRDSTASGCDQQTASSIERGASFLMTSPTAMLSRASTCLAAAFLWSTSLKRSASGASDMSTRPSSSDEACDEGCYEGTPEEVGGIDCDANPFAALEGRE